MKTRQTTVRMHMNPDEALGTLSHVVDKEFRDKEVHVNPDGEFEVWVNKGVYETYKEVFGEAIETYNQKQKRKDRRIMDSEGDSVTGYIKSIKNSKRGKRRKVVEKKLDDGTVQKISIESENGQRVLYELVVSAGNCNKAVDERGRIVYTEDGHEIHPYRMEREVNKRAMRKFLYLFEKAYPRLKVAVAAYHADEQYLNGKGNYEWGIEHMHLNFIPVADGYARGLSKQASISKALEQMGFKNGTDKDGIYRNAYWQFCSDAQKMFESILKDEYLKWCVFDKKMKHEDIAELEIIHPDRGQGKKNLDPDAYRTLKELENRKRSVTADLGEIREEKKDVEEEVVKAKRRLKKANARSEDVLLEAFTEADERIADVTIESMQKRLELEEELVSVQLEVMKANEYHSYKTEQADEYFNDAVRNAKGLEKEAKAYIDSVYKEYNSDFAKCKNVLKNIQNDIKQFQSEVEELKQYLLSHCIVANGQEISLLDDFTEQMEKKKKRRNNNAGNAGTKLQRQITDRLAGIEDADKFLNMKCKGDYTGEIEMK